MFLALSLSEGILRLAERLTRPRTNVPLLIPDSKIGVRGNPNFPEHDTKGFRNKQAALPGTVEIVCLGDSQTYGWGIAPHQAWPQQLEKFTGRKTYNMAIESSGPVQSYLLLQEALELKPKLILFALYAGNDLFDAYSSVYEKNLASQFKSHDPKVLEEIKSKEDVDPIHAAIEKQAAIAYRDDRYSNAESCWLDQFQIYRLCHRLRATIVEHDEWSDIRQEALNPEAPRPVFEGHRVKTVFTPPYRLLALNLDDVRIGEGLRITSDIIQAVGKENNSNTDIVFVLIPTKETAFKKAVNLLMNDSDYGSLIKYEESFWTSIIATLEANHLRYIDLRTPLQERIGTGQALYPITWDGHPNAEGHLAIAQLISERLK